jgi:hypothetical protein
MTNTRRTVILLGMIFAAAGISSLFPKKPEELRAKEQPGPCDTSAKQKAAAKEMIQYYGYDCRVVDLMCYHVAVDTESATVYCNNRRYSSNLRTTAGSGQ